MKMIKKLIIWNAFFYVWSSLFAYEQGLYVSGRIFFSSKKPIQIYLVDEETSKKKFTGIQSLMITPDTNDISTGYITFQFKNIMPGDYGIRCFQDTNGNKKLDRGLFGPSEPWGLSWNEKKTSRWPSFKNYCFNVTNNVNNININLTD